MTDTTTRLRLFTAGLALAIALAAASTSRAATITWGAAQNITADTDVSTNGSLVSAYNLGLASAPATTINGVNFAPFAITPGLTSVTVGNAKVEGVNLSASTASSSPNPPFAALSADYRALLFTYGGDASSPDLKLTLSGLTAGNTYEFQYWANFSYGIPSAMSVTAQAGNNVTTIYNTTGLSGGVGQFAIGTFIADNASQVINFHANNIGQSSITGFQLRQTAVAPVSAVPEPGSALVGLLALGLCGARLGRRGRA